MLTQATPTSLRLRQAMDLFEKHLTLPFAVSLAFVRGGRVTGRRQRKKLAATKMPPRSFWQPGLVCPAVQTVIQLCDFCPVFDFSQASPSVYSNLPEDVLLYMKRLFTERVVYLIYYNKIAALSNELTAFFLQLSPHYCNF